LPVSAISHVEMTGMTPPKTVTATAKLKDTPIARTEVGNDSQNSAACEFIREMSGKGRGDAEDDHADLGRGEPG
jgi:hypothetical protein